MKPSYPIADSRVDLLKAEFYFLAGEFMTTLDETLNATEFEPCADAIVIELMANQEELANRGPGNQDFEIRENADQENSGDGFVSSLDYKHADYASDNKSGDETSIHSSDHPIHKDRDVVIIDDKGPSAARADPKVGRERRRVNRNQTRQDATVPRGAAFAGGG
jgi:hypothetical protein